MSAQANRAIVRRFFHELCNARNMGVAEALFAGDHIAHDPSIPGISPGPEGVQQTIAIYHKAFPDAHWHIEDMIAEGDKVVTRWVGRGTQTEELQGDPPIPPTGKAVVVPGIWIHRIADGKIVESWNVWDTLGMLQQLGVISRKGREAA